MSSEEIRAMINATMADANKRYLEGLTESIMQGKMIAKKPTEVKGTSAQAVFIDELAKPSEVKVGQVWAIDGCQDCCRMEVARIENGLAYDSQGCWIWVDSLLKNQHWEYVGEAKVIAGYVPAAHGPIVADEMAKFEDYKDTYADISKEEIIQKLRGVNGDPGNWFMSAVGEERSFWDGCEGFAHGCEVTDQRTGKRYRNDGDGASAKWVEVTVRWCASCGQVHDLGKECK